MKFSSTNVSPATATVIAILRNQVPIEQGLESVAVVVDSEYASEVVDEVLDTLFPADECDRYDQQLAA